MSSRRAVDRNRTEKEKKRGGLSKEAKILLGIGALLVAGAAFLFATANPSSPSGEPPASSNASAGLDTGGAGQLVREDSYRLETAGSKVTLVEFLDLECEACGAMYPTVKRILDEYGDRMTFVVRYFPLHRNSVLAAKAAEAAGRQGKYWEMYALLFESQSAWGEKSQPQTDTFLRYAQSLALDMERFRADLNDPSLDAKVSRDKSDGTAAGVKGTPTFFVNGVQIGSVMSYEQMKSRLDAALR